MRRPRPRPRPRGLATDPPEALCLALALALAVALASAATLEVDPKGADAAGCGRAPAAPCQTLARGLAEAAAGDTVRLAPGTYLEVRLQPAVGRLTIEGTGASPADVVIDGEGRDRVMTLLDGAAGARLRMLTLRGGKAWTGGCLLLDMLRNTSTGVLLEDVAFEGCAATGPAPASTGGGPLPYVANAGGGLYAAKGASPTLRRVVFRACSAWLGGGGAWFHDDSAAVLEDCLFERNKADNFGGGIVPEGRSAIVVRRTRFVANESPYGGGGDSGTTSTARFEDCVFEDNFSAWSGGAFYHFGDDRITFVRTVFRRNRVRAGDGGAVAVTGSCAPVYEDCTFLDNQSEKGGGGHVTMSGSSSLVVRRSTFRRSSSSQGGAFYNRGKTTTLLEDVEAEDGAASDWGGGFVGVWGDGSSLTIRRGRFARFSSRANAGSFLILQGQVHVAIEGATIANCSGGAGTLHASGRSTFLIRDTVFEDNVASRGGAIAAIEDAQVVVEGGRMARNRARERGGALFVAAQAHVTLNGTVVEENAAPAGGGLYVESAHRVALVGATFARNRAQYGAAVGVAAALPEAAVLEANGTLFEANEAAFAGGVLYDEGTRPRLALDEAVRLRGNAADWGAGLATRPLRIVVNGTGLAGAPGEPLVVSASLMDGLGQLVTSALPPVLVQLEAPNGLTVNTLAPIQVFKRGTVQFELDFYVSDSADRSFPLRLVSDAATAEVKLEVRPCVAGFSSVATATSFRCVPCAAGSYGLEADSGCRPCPAGASCPGKTVLLVEEGFWLEPASLARARPALFRCPRGYCCPGGKCPPERQCAPHRTATLCGTCEEGYSDWGGQCTRCDTPQYALLLVPMAAGALLVVGAWFLSAGLPNSGKVKSVIFFVQAAALIVKDEAGSFVSQLSWDSLFSSSLRCPFELAPVQRTLLGYWIPAFAFAGLCLFVAGALAVEVVRGRLSRKRRDGALPVLQRRLFVMAFQIATVAYIAIANTSIQFLDCVSVGDERVLRRFPSVSCGSGEYRRWLPVVYVMLVAYVVALPVGLAGLVVRLGRRGLGWLYSDEAVWRYGVVFACYRAPGASTRPAPPRPAGRAPRLTRGQVVVMARRIALIALDTAFASADNARALALFLACVCFVVLHGLASPYRQPLDNAIEALFLLVLAVTSSMEMATSAAFARPDYDVRARGRAGRGERARGRLLLGKDEEERGSELTPLPGGSLDDGAAGPEAAAGLHALAPRAPLAGPAGEEAEESWAQRRPRPRASPSVGVATPLALEGVSLHGGDDRASSRSPDGSVRAALLGTAGAPAAAYDRGRPTRAARSPSCAPSGGCMTDPERPGSAGGRGSGAWAGEEGSDPPRLSVTLLEADAPPPSRSPRTRLPPLPFLLRPSNPVHPAAPDSETPRGSRAPPPTADPEAAFPPIAAAAQGDPVADPAAAPR
eukprot:tig00021094_g18119.t1